MKNKILLITLAFFLISCSFISASDNKIWYGRNESNPSQMIPVLLNNLGKLKMDLNLLSIVANSISLGGIEIFSWGDIPDFFKLDGSRNMEGNINVGGNNITNASVINATIFIGDGSQLTGISGGIWDNVSGTATYYGDVNITGNLSIDGLINGVDITDLDIGVFPNRSLIDYNDSLISNITDIYTDHNVTTLFEYNDTSGLIDNISTIDNLDGNTTIDFSYDENGSLTEITYG